jgi:hypothetical protein
MGLKDDFIKTDCCNLDYLDGLNDFDIITLMYYHDLTLDVNCVYEYYEQVSDYIKGYLGAVYVGVPEDNPELLKYVSEANNNYIAADIEIDKLKQIAAYEYLYGEKPKSNNDNLMYYIKRYYQNEADMNDMSPYELQFWWELIPSNEYVNYGDIRIDVMMYYGWIDN